MSADGQNEVHGLPDGTTVTNTFGPSEDGSRRVLQHTVLKTPGGLASTVTIARSSEDTNGDGRADLITQTAAWIAYYISPERRRQSRINNVHYKSFIPKNDKGEAVLSPSVIQNLGQEVNRLGIGECGARAAHLYWVLSQAKGNFCGFKVEYAGYFKSQYNNHAFLVATDPANGQKYQVDPHANLVRPVTMKGMVMTVDGGTPADTKVLDYMTAEMPIGGP